MSDRNALAPMPQSEIDMYAESAYGTPHEPYIRGDVAYGGELSNRHRISNMPIEPTNALQERYAKAYAYSLRNPIVALGLDFSRLGMIDPAYFYKITELGGDINGLYSERNDAAISNGRRGGSTDAHEMMHRGFSKLGITGVEKYEHKMMDQQSMDDYRRYLDNIRMYGPGAWEANYGPGHADNTETAEDLANLRDMAAQKIYSRKPFGGPR